MKQDLNCQLLDFYQWFVFSFFKNEIIFFFIKKLLKNGLRKNKNDRFEKNRRGFVKKISNSF
jgi:hypothetical protein